MGFDDLPDVDSGAHEPGSTIGVGSAKADPWKAPHLRRLLGEHLDDRALGAPGPPGLVGDETVGGAAEPNAEGSGLAAHRNSCHGAILHKTYAVASGGQTIPAPPPAGRRLAARQAHPAPGDAGRVAEEWVGP